MKEASLRRSIMKKLQDTEGGFWFHVHGTPYQKAGLPDIIGCWQGRFVGFEVKLPGANDATPLQRYTLERIRSAGGIASLIRSFEDAKTVLDAHRDDLDEGGDAPR